MLKITHTARNIHAGHSLEKKSFKASPPFRNDMFYLPYAVITASAENSLNKVNDENYNNDHYDYSEDRPDDYQEHI